MHHSGQLRTLVQTFYKKTIPQSTQVFSLQVSTKNINPTTNDLGREDQNIKQKLQRRVHTSGKHFYNCNTPMTFEPWMDEDIICVLQGSCMPGSTRYCRTNSMFGKLEMVDIMQGVPIVRRFSTLSGNPRLSPFIRNYHSINPQSISSNFLLGKTLEQNLGYSLFTQTDSLPTISHNSFTTLLHRYYSPSATQNAAEPSVNSGDVSKQMSQRDKLKRAVKEYGSTVIVFHISMSLVCLAGFYVAVSSGLDVAALLRFCGFSEEVITARMATNASTFVISYAVYKMFMPVRLGITLTVAPLLVQYLRRIKVLKPPMT